MKGCLRSSTFIFWISPNIAKYTYGQLPFEQHHRIKGGGGDTNVNTCRVWMEGVCREMLSRMRVGLNKNDINPKIRSLGSLESKF
jgi:hypothetical protein